MRDRTFHGLEERLCKKTERIVDEALITHTLHEHLPSTNDSRCCEQVLRRLKNLEKRINSYILNSKEKLIPFFGKSEEDDSEQDKTRSEKTNTYRDLLNRILPTGDGILDFLSDRISDVPDLFSLLGDAIWSILTLSRLNGVEEGLKQLRAKLQNERAQDNAALNSRLQHMFRAITLVLDEIDQKVDAMNTALSSSINNLGEELTDQIASQTVELTDIINNGVHDITHGISNVNEAVTSVSNLIDDKTEQVMDDITKVDNVVNAIHNDTVSIDGQLQDVQTDIDQLQHSISQFGPQRSSNQLIQITQQLQGMRATLNRVLQVLSMGVVFALVPVPTTDAKNLIRTPNRVYSSYSKDFSEFDTGVNYDPAAPYYVKYLPVDRDVISKTWRTDKVVWGAFLGLIPYKHTNIGTWTLRYRIKYERYVASKSKHPIKFEPTGQYFYGTERSDTIRGQQSAIASGWEWVDSLSTVGQDITIGFGTQGPSYGINGVTFNPFDTNETQIDLSRLQFTAAAEDMVQSTEGDTASLAEEVVAPSQALEQDIEFVSTSRLPTKTEPFRFLQRVIVLKEGSTQMVDLSVGNVYSSDVLKEYGIIQEGSLTRGSYRIESIMTMQKNELIQQGDPRWSKPIWYKQVYVVAEKVNIWR